MRRQCREGAVLCKHFERVLRVWGFEDVDRQAAERIPFSPAQQRKASRIARKAELAMFKARHNFVEHMANCVVCSRHLVGG